MEPDVVIRRAASEDIGRITGIENLSFDGDRFSRRQFTYLAFRAKGVFLVAETGGTVAGYISLLAHSRRNRLRVYAIAVAPEYRGRNIAGTLISEAKEFAVRSGFAGLSLEVRTDNAAAIGLYRKHGFEAAGVRKAYYADGTDASVMTWEINRLPRR